MQKSAKYILSSYSFIFSKPIEKLLLTGYQLKDGNPIPSFDENLLIDLCSEVQETFMNEDSILEINDDLIIVGDIHGSLHDLLRIIKFIQINNSKVLFLGNYIDYGNFSLECMTILFALKVMYPKSIFLLRGNHEFESVCSKFGFKDEIKNYYNPKKLIQLKKNENNPMQDNHYDEYYSNCKNMNCYKYSRRLYYSFIKAFSYLPIGAIVNKTTFCVHGGLSPQISKIDGLNEIIDRPIYNLDDNSIMADLLCSEPFHNIHLLFEKNINGRGNFFSRESVINFLKENSLSRIIRSNKYAQNGFTKNFDDQCVTIFSSSAFDKYQDNCSAVLQLFQKDDLLQLSTFPPIKRLQKCEAVYYKVEPLNSPLQQIPFSFVHPNLPCINTNLQKINSQKSENRIRPHLRVKSAINTKFVTNPRKSAQLVTKPIIHDSISYSVINNYLNES